MLLQTVITIYLITLIESNQIIEQQSKKIVIDPCASNPCVNGICRVLSFGYYCECKSIYEGVNCNRFKNSYCPINPCQHNGTCTSHNGYEPFTCACKRPYTGLHCESLPDINAVEEIKLDTQNSIYLMNQTLNLLKNRFKKLKSTNNEDQKLTIVSNLIYSAARARALTKDTLKKIEADIFVSLVDKFIDEAISYKSDSILNSTQKLSQTFENYVSSIKLPSAYYSIATRNIAVLTFTVNNTDLVSTGFIQHDSNDTSNMILVKDATQVDFNSVKTSSFLNIDLLKKITNKTSKPTFSFAVYETSILFDVNSSMLQLSQQTDNFNCSDIISDQIVTNVVSVSSDKDLSQFNSTNFVTTFFRTLPSVTTISCNQFKKVKYKCVYWDYKLSEWNSYGCTYSFTSEELHTCDCNHLTNFAVLMTFDESSDSDCVICQSILKYSTYFGNGLSIIGLLITIVIYTKDIIKKKVTKSYSVSFKSMFDYYIEILVSLSASLLTMNVLYLIFSVLTWQSDLSACMITGVLLHYFLLSSFSWMLCFSILQYLTFNKVLFVINKYYLKSAIFSLSFPLIPIVIVLSIDWKLYQNPKSYCWLSGYSSVYAILLPIMLILVINLFVFTLIMKKHCSCRFKTSLNQSTDKLLKKETNIKRQTTIFMTCFMNLGLTWTTGFLLIIPINDEIIRTAIAFLFCVFNSLQGFFLFTIYVIVSKSRRIYMKYAANEKLKKQTYSSTESTLKTTTLNTTRNDEFIFNQSNDTEVYFINANNYYSKL